MIARVIPLTQTRAIRGLFDYMLPPELEPSAGVGSLLRVPFAGRTILGGRRRDGRQLGASAGEARDRCRAAPGPAAGRPGRARVWMAAEYCSTPARALQILLPAGAAQGLTREAGPGRLHHRRRQLQLSKTAPASPPGQREALEALADQPAASLQSSARQLLRRLESRGLVDARPTPSNPAAHRPTRSHPPPLQPRR